MEFEESDDELVESADDILPEEDGLDGIDLLSESSDEPEEDLSELDELDKKDKARIAAKRSLKIRRAIEDFFEERKLKSELDYLFDDDTKD